MTWWFGRKHKPEDNSDIKAAMEARDAVLIEAEAAIRKVDRIQNAVIEQYAAAERQRVRSGRRS